MADEDPIDNKEERDDDEKVIVTPVVGDGDSSKLSKESGGSVSVKGVSAGAVAGTAAKSPMMFIVILIIVILLGVVGYFVFSKDSGGGNSNLPSKMSTQVDGFDVNTDVAYSQSELWGLDTTTDELWMYGYYQDSGYGANLVENLSDSGGSLLDTTNANGVDYIENGDLVLVGGTYSDDGYTFVVSAIGKITEDDIDVFNTFKYPYATIEILESPSEVTHGCEYLEMKVRMTNIGKIPIRKSDFYTFSTDLPKYKFIQITDGVEDGGYDYNEELQDVVHQGYLHFEDLQPGESKEFAYGLGGYVLKNNVGTGGQPNTMCSPDFSFPGGEREVKLAIGYLKPGSYTENILTSVSDPVTLNVLNCECDLSKPLN